MWYWLHKSTHRPFIVWLYLGGFIVLVHAVLFFILFFIYHDGVAHLTFIITPNSIRHPIEFRVAVATIKKPVALESRGTTTPSQKAKQPPVHKTTTTTNKKKAVPQKQTVSKALKPTVKKEKVIPPPVEVVTPPKIAVPVETPMAQDKPVAFEIAAQQGIQGLEKEYAALGEELTTQWAPPPGVPPDCKCTITIAIDRQGAIAHMAVDASSGMLIYDVAAQSVVSELHFPRIAWGKSITITFTV